MIIHLGMDVGFIFDVFFYDLSVHALTLQNLQKRWPLQWMCLFVRLRKISGFYNIYVVFGIGLGIGVQQHLCHIFLFGFVLSLQPHNPTTPQT